MRNLVTNLIVIIYLIGTAVGPHPLPTAVCDFEPIIGREIRVQLLENAETLAVAVVASAASGFNAMGAFRPIHTRLRCRFLRC